MNSGKTGATLLGGVALATLILFGSSMPNTAVSAEPGDITIDGKLVFPESMTSTSDGTVIIGSTKGLVYRAKPGETVAKSWITLKQGVGQLSVLGVLADEKSHTLWTCVNHNTFNGQKPTEPPKLMAFSLSQGKLLHSYDFPDTTGVCNDITIAKDGTAYASDTTNGRDLHTEARRQRARLVRVGRAPQGH